MIRAAEHWQTPKLKASYHGTERSSYSTCWLRRHIQLTLAGAVIGAGLITVPAHADNYYVENANDSGSGSLRQQIILANSDTDADITIRLPGLGRPNLPEQFDLQTALPTITNLNSVVEFDLGQNITLSQTLALGGNGKLVIFNTGVPQTMLTGNVSAVADTHAATNVLMFDSSQIQGNVTASGTSSYASTFLLTQNSSITGNVIANNYGNFNLINNSFIEGQVTVNGGSLNLYGDNGVDGLGSNNIFGGNGGNGGAAVGSANGSNGSAGAITLTQPTYSPGPSVTGDVEIRKGGSVTLFAGNGGAGGKGYDGGSGGSGSLTATSDNSGIGGNGGMGAKGGNGLQAGDVSIQGDVTINNASIILQAGNGGNGGDGGNGGNGGIGGIGSTGGSTLQSGAGGNGGNGGDGGSGGKGGNVNITGAVTVNNSNVTLQAGAGGASGNGGSGGNGGNGGDGNGTSPGGDGGAGGTGGYGGYGGSGGDATISNDVIANGNSVIRLIAGNGNIQGANGANGAGGAGGSDNGGNGGAGGHGGMTFYTGFGANSGIDGNVTANDNSRFILMSGTYDEDNNGGISSITGYVTANDNSAFELNRGVIFAFDDSSANAAVTANDNSTFFLDSSAIIGTAIFNDSSTLFATGGNLVVDFGSLNDLSSTSLTFGQNATFAPDLVSAVSAPSNSFLPGIGSGPMTVLGGVSPNGANLRPYFNADEVPSDFVIPVVHDPGVDGANLDTTNSVNVLSYLSIDSTRFNPAVVSPLDMGVAYMPVGAMNEVHLYLNSNDVDFNKLPGSENARSLGSALNGWINPLQTDDNYFNVGDLPTLNVGSQTLSALDALSAVSYTGNLQPLDGIIDVFGLEAYSAHNSQAYWNQKSFVESILNSLRNNENMSGGNPSTFALNQVSGINNAPLQLASLRQAMATSLNQLTFDGNNSSASSGVWASYNGNHQSTDADSGIGSNDWSSSSDGFNLGYTSGGENFSWGVAAGHQKSDLSFRDINANGTQDGWNLGLYGSLKSKSTYLTGILGYGKYDNGSNNGFSDTTSFENKATSVSLEIGKHLSEKRSGGFTPYASVLWTKIKQDNAQIGGSGSGIALQNSSNNVFTTQLGVRFNHRMYDKKDTLKGGWQVGLAWLHQGGDTGMPSNIGISGATTFGVQNTPLSGNSLQVQLGAYGRIHNNLIGFAGYQGTFGNSQKINAVNAGIGYQF